MVICRTGKLQDNTPASRQVSLHFMLAAEFQITTLACARYRLVCIVASIRCIACVTHTRTSAHAHSHNMFAFDSKHADSNKVVPAQQTRTTRNLDVPAEQLLTVVLFTQAMRQDSGFNGL